MGHHHPDRPHEHCHNHDHPHDGEMTVAETLRRLLEHWIHHNNDHIGSYRQWADKARDQGLEEAAAEIEKAMETTAAVSEAFRRARASIPKA